MAWTYLLIAGILEIFWSTFLKLSAGFTKPGYTVLTIIGMISSFVFLAKAIKTLPLGTAYAVWTGIGAIGAIIVGIICFHEAITLPRIIFLIFIMTGIIGLKLTGA